MRLRRRPRSCRKGCRKIKVARRRGRARTVALTLSQLRDMPPEDQLTDSFTGSLRLSQAPMVFSALTTVGCFLRKREVRGSPNPMRTYLLSSHAQHDPTRSGGMPGR